MVLALGSPLHEKVAPGAQPSSPPSGGFEGSQCIKMQSPDGVSPLLYLCVVVLLST